MKQDFLNTVNPEFLNIPWNEKRTANITYTQAGGFVLRRTGKQ
jgi:hypothetical protein